MLRAFLFDFSGTIVDDLEVSLIATNHAITTLAGPASKLTRDQFVDRASMPYWNLFEPLGISEEEARKRVPALFIESYMKQVGRIDLFSDVREALVELRRRKFQTGIVSSTPRSIIRTILFKRRVESLFDLVLGLEDCKELKPSPQPIIEAIKRLKRESREVGYVGDMDEDVKAAHAAGAVSIAVWRQRRHYQKLDRLTSSRPRFLVKRLTEILDVDW
jgi:HAD superfamily hydrolase (TIGR01549 family)